MPTGAQLGWHNYGIYGYRCSVLFFESASRSDSFVRIVDPFPTGFRHMSPLAHAPSDARPSSLGANMLDVAGIQSAVLTVGAVSLVVDLARQFGGSIETLLRRRTH